MENTKDIIVWRGFEINRRGGYLDAYVFEYSNKDFSITIKDNHQWVVGEETSKVFIVFRHNNSKKYIRIREASIDLGLEKLNRKIDGFMSDSKYPEKIPWHGWVFDRVVTDFYPGFVEYEFSGNNDFLTIKVSSKIDDTENETVLVSIESVFLNKELFVECDSVEMALKCLDLEMEKVAKTLKVFLNFVEPS